jgi:heat shock protein HtpX
MQIAKVFGLMTALTLFLVLVGQYLGGSQGAGIFFVLAMVMNFGTYWFSDKAVLRMYKAKVIGPDDAPDLFRMVDRLRQNAGLPMPTVAIAPQLQPNAFATGRNKNHAVVCVTIGLMNMLDAKELEGVIAHELAHIKHRHMLVGTLAAGLAGTVALLASIAKWGVILGTGRDDDRGNPFVLLIMAFVAPLVAVIIQTAISRQNEFQADATAARIVGDRRGLQSALRRIQAGAERIPMNVNPAGAHMAIINPFAGGAVNALQRMTSTHPPTEDRIAALDQVQL